MLFKLLIFSSSPLPRVLTYRENEQGSGENQQGRYPAILSGPSGDQLCHLLQRTPFLSMVRIFLKSSTTRMLSSRDAPPHADVLTSGLRPQ